MSPRQKNSTGGVSKCPNGIALPSLHHKTTACARNARIIYGFPAKPGAHLHWQDINRNSRALFGEIDLPQAAGPRAEPQRPRRSPCSLAPKPRISNLALDKRPLRRHLHTCRLRPRRGYDAAILINPDAANFNDLRVDQLLGAAPGGAIAALATPRAPPSAVVGARAVVAAAADGDGAPRYPERDESDVLLARRRRRRHIAAAATAAARKAPARTLGRVKGGEAVCRSVKRSSDVIFLDDAKR